MRAISTRVIAPLVHPVVLGEVFVVRLLPILVIFNLDFVHSKSRLVLCFVLLDVEPLDFALQSWSLVVACEVAKLGDSFQNHVNEFNVEAGCKEEK